MQMWNPDNATYHNSSDDDLSVNFWTDNETSGNRVRYTQSALLLAFFVLAIAGNVSIIARLYHNRKAHFAHKMSNINVLCVNLAIADISSALCCILSNAVLYIVEQFLAGDVMCKMLKYLQKVGVAASTFIIVAISMDKCFAIVFPMHSVHGRSTTKFMVVGVWAGAVLLCIPQVWNSPGSALMPDSERSHRKRKSMQSRANFQITLPQVYPERFCPVPIQFAGKPLLNRRYKNLLSWCNGWWALWPACGIERYAFQEIVLSVALRVSFSNSVSAIGSSAGDVEVFTQ